MSLPSVRLSQGDDRSLHRPGFPIRASPGQSLLSSSPGLFAACRALRRVSAPRHPPHALSSLPAVLRWSIPLACIRLADLPNHDVKELVVTARSRPRHRHGFGLSSATDRSHGADRNRTDGLRLAKAALSQLSYSPARSLVGLGRLELPTSPLSGVRSNHLSYRPSSGNGSRLSKLSRGGAPVCEHMLLRKEVIQPQVPLRLPCYDFTPVTGRTLGGCFPCGLAHQLPVQPTSMV